MARPRTTYTAQYKLAAVKMITDQKLSVAEQELVGAIEEVHADVKQRYGSPRMTAELKARG